MADTFATDTPATAPAQTTPKKAKSASSRKKPRAKPRSFPHFRDGQQHHKEPEGERWIFASSHQQVLSRQLLGGPREVRAFHQEVSQVSCCLWRA
ncbi:hypothetical protein C0J52_26628 [Blattella germanica]|nr:hypothetical protein C0J52_26628 [Blattella germanica]